MPVPIARTSPMMCLFYVSKVTLGSLAVGCSYAMFYVITSDTVAPIAASFLLSSDSLFGFECAWHTWSWGWPSSIHLIQFTHCHTDGIEQGRVSQAHVRTAISVFPLYFRHSFIHLVLSAFGTQYGTFNTFTFERHDEAVRFPHLFTFIKCSHVLKMYIRFSRQIVCVPRTFVDTCSPNTAM